MDIDYINFEPDVEEMRSKTNVQRTGSLFHETIQGSSKETMTPIYTLKDRAFKGLPSAYQVYMHSIDEYDAAMKIVGSMAHWRKLCGLKWFREGIPGTGFEGVLQWRSDMAARDSREAKRVLIEECRDNNVSAARALDNKAKETTKAKDKKIKAGPEDVVDQDVVDFLKKRD